jgi:putative membrane protein
VLALFLVANLGIGISATGWLPLLEAAVVLALVNLLVRPLVKILTLPITCLTLGLFSWVVSALMLWLTSALVPGFTVAGFVPALEGAVLLGLVSGVAHWLIR